MSVRVLKSRVSGPLEAVLPAFAGELTRLGFARISAEQHVCFLACLDRWMVASKLGVGDLSPDVVDAFLAHRRDAGYALYSSRRAIAPLLEFLTAQGLLPVVEPSPLGPVDRLLQEYAAYLVVERGLAAETVSCYLRCVRPFVATRVRGEEVDFAGLTTGDVTRYVVAVCPGKAKGSAKLVVTTLRSLLGWLHVTGVVPGALGGAVPAAAGWRLARLPEPLEPDAVGRLLASCDGKRVVGRRDYAILLLLVRLGLRAGEVAGLRLDDIDWRHGEIAVTGKGNRTERLPLPADVGAAISGYLRRGRPVTALDRSVFVRVRAPHRGLAPSGVSAVVRGAAGRAGLGEMAAHRLRHTAATAMLRSGGTLAEVGQGLRHRTAFSTAIYAKVDRDALRTLAEPWPATAAGGSSGGVS
jgi:site-specific recombinase XerD